MYKFLKFALGMIMLGAATLAAALPPKPGSGYDSDEITKLMFGIAWYPMGSVTPEQAEKNRIAKEGYIAKALQILKPGCDRNDAHACAYLADTETFYTRFANPRAARQAFAVKAADLYAQHCEAKPDELAACESFSDFLDDVQKNDKNRPEYATDGLKAQRLRLARAYGRACHIPTLIERSENLSEEQFDAALKAELDAGIGYADSNCEKGLELLDKLATSEARSLREVLCARNQDEACHALGRLSAAKLAEDGPLAADCNAGDAEKCTALGSRWMYRSSIANYGVETRKWSGKACAAGSPRGCFMSGVALVQTQFGAPDYPAALAAMTKACQTMPANMRDQACKAEKGLAAAIAAAKAKAAAATQ